MLFFSNYVALSHVLNSDTFNPSLIPRWNGQLRYVTWFCCSACCTISLNTWFRKHFIQKRTDGVCNKMKSSTLLESSILWELRSLLPDRSVQKLMIADSFSYCIIEILWTYNIIAAHSTSVCFIFTIYLILFNLSWDFCVPNTIVLSFCKFWDAKDTFI